MIGTGTWTWAAICVGAGLVSGIGLAWVAGRLLRAPERRPEVRDMAGPVCTFLFWLALATGVVLAVAAVEPDTISDVPANVLAYLPRIFAAGLILLAGRALAVVSAAAAGRAVARALGRPSDQISFMVKLAVNLAAGVLALSQLGVDTTVLVVLAAGLAVTFGLSFSLLVGFGGREAAKEIAAGRYLRRYVTPGCELCSAELRGSVVALHPLTIELLTEDGRHLHVPHSRLLGDVLEVSTNGSGPLGAPDEADSEPEEAPTEELPAPPAPPAAGADAGAGARPVPPPG